MPLSNKQIVDFYFNEKEKNKFRCRCGNERKVGNGYQNLLTHIYTKHPNYLQEIQNQESVFKPSDKVTCIYGWLDWIISNGYPFNFCENAVTKKYSSLKPISKKTLIKYLELLTRVVEQRISQELPNHFGIMLDGWTDMSVSTHFVAIFAIWPNERNEQKTALLAFSPLLQEDRFSADAYIELIEFTLQVFKKQMEDILFFVCDNDSVNKSIAKKLELPMIGCNSHRLNLALKKLMEPHEGLLQKVQNLMKKLLSLKKSAVLRKKTELRPVLRNDTRWWSTFVMVERYIKLRPFLDESDTDIVLLMLSPAEEIQIRVLHENLQKINSVSKKLQTEGTNLYEIRILFETILEEYPHLGYYLGLESESISSNPDFEKAIVNSIKGEITSEQKHHLIIFQNPEDLDEIVEKKDYAEKILEIKTRKKEKLDLKWIPGTSDKVERLFSKSNYIFNDYRKKTEPANLESQIFLSANSMFWDIKVVNSIVNDSADFFQ